MSSSEPFYFHVLPKDLVRLVIESLADLNHKDALNCALVSKEVKSWVEPIVYRNIKITRIPELKGICRLVTDPNSTKPTNFFATHVKTLAFMETKPMDQVIAILRACPGIQSLALWDINHDQSSLLELREELQSLTTSSPSGVPFPNLRQLSLLSLYFPPDQRHFAHPLFRNLTHLEAHFFDWSDIEDDPQEWDWKTGLGQLKHLTHLRVSPPTRKHQTFEEGIRKILAHCPPSLQVFISWIDDLGLFISATVPDEIKAIQEGDLDVRVVLAFVEDQDSICGHDGGGVKKDPSVDYSAIICSSPDLVREWSGIELEKSLWRRAEEIIEGRRKRLQVGCERDEGVK